MNKKTIINNPYNNKNLARSLRKNQTICEKFFWTILRNNNFLGYKFRRQFPIDKYIVDFFSYKLKLIIEIDGPVHESFDKKTNDMKRQKVLESFGYKILRFNTEEIMNSNKIIDELKNYIETKSKI